MGAWGEGSLREKRPGVFEISVAVGVDPVSGRTVQRSFWFHGALEDAEERRRELAAQFAEYRSIRRLSTTGARPPGPGSTELQCLSVDDRFDGAIRR
jgi:hypothetical protein